MFKCESVESSDLVKLSNHKRCFSLSHEIKCPNPLELDSIKFLIIRFRRETVVKSLCPSTIIITLAPVREIVSRCSNESC